MSLVCIVCKRALLALTAKEAAQFEERFWSGGNLAYLYESVRRDPNVRGEAAVFVAGYEEFVRQQTSGKADPDDVLAAVQRQLRVAHTREVERLDGGLAFLATVGSTSPYVGLFGTVWGIMSAFISIGNVKQAALATVAPRSEEHTSELRH